MEEKFILLESGKEFFGDFFEQLQCAEEYVLIKQFLWRNDDTGQKVAKMLLDCMERGVKVYIIKDRLGAIYEYGEASGQSFFHDAPLNDSFFSTHSLATVYLQARFIFSKFYKNPVSKQNKNLLKSILVDHKLSHVMDSYKLYDHSKIVVIDGRFAYLGGMGFANEFSENTDRWLDYMLKISDCAFVQDLMQTLACEGEAKILESRHFYLDPHNRILEALGDSRKEVIIEMPFWGNSAYIDALAAAAKRGVEIYLHLPQRATSHHYRNLHFLKTLFRRAKNSPRIHVTFSTRMLHGKGIVVDQNRIFLGSHNLHMDAQAVREIMFESQDVKLVSSVRNRLMNNISKGTRFVLSPSWSEIILPSRLEYLSIKLQTLFSRGRSAAIAHARSLGQGEIKRLLLK